MLACLLRRDSWHIREVAGSSVTHKGLIADPGTPLPPFLILKGGGGEGSPQRGARILGLDKRIFSGLHSMATAKISANKVLRGTE